MSRECSYESTSVKLKHGPLAGLQKPDRERSGVIGATQNVPEVCLGWRELGIGVERFWLWGGPDEVVVGWELGGPKSVFLQGVAARRPREIFDKWWTLGNRSLSEPTLCHSVRRRVP